MPALIPTGARLSLYDDVAQRAADVVVRRYSTSFGMATRLLPQPVRTHVRNIYALVRLADEVVDGASAEAGGDPASARGWLDALADETHSAIRTGYSTNVLVHAFARTARRAGFGAELTAPFFASMAMDLDRTTHDEESLATYIVGSAEVVGLMCLRVFALDVPAGRRAECYEVLERGARALGAAFQKVNFLRDLSDDGDRLGRSYFVGVNPEHLTETQKDAILADIRADLAEAATAIDMLPVRARTAVAVAHALFGELARRLAATPADQIARGRVRVPGPVKARLTAEVLVRRR